jgi:hypothetical protein
MPAATRAKLQQRYKTFKADVAQLRKDLVRADTCALAGVACALIWGRAARRCGQKRVAASGDRDELFAGAANDLDRASTDQRQKLLDNNARLDNSTKRLEESQRLALEAGPRSPIGPPGAGVGAHVHSHRQLRLPPPLNRANRWGHHEQSQGPARAAGERVEDGALGADGESSCHSVLTLSVFVYMCLRCVAGRGGRHAGQERADPQGHGAPVGAPNCPRRAPPLTGRAVRQGRHQQDHNRGHHPCLARHHWPDHLSDYPQVSACPKPRAFLGPGWGPRGWGDVVQRRGVGRGGWVVCRQQSLHCDASQRAAGRVRAAASMIT